MTDPGLGSNPPLPPRLKNEMRRNSASPTSPSMKKTPLQSSQTVGDFSPLLTGHHHGSFSGHQSPLQTNSHGTVQDRYQHPSQHQPHEYPTHPSSPFAQQMSSHGLSFSPSSNHGSVVGTPPPPLPERFLAQRSLSNVQCEVDERYLQQRDHYSAERSSSSSAMPQGDTYVAPDAIAQIRHQYRQQQKLVHQDPQQQHQHFNSAPLEEQDWYWSNISKEEVTGIMKDKPDGAFLIRDAARLPGYYTLTLRKGGVNRLIRIMFKDGHYGFAEPLEFESVVALVAFYKEHSLAPYSPKLDISLGMPVSRRLAHDDIVDRMNQSDEVIIDRLRLLESDLKVKGHAYNSQKQQFERINEDIKNMRMEITAQMEIIGIFGESLKEHMKHHNSCPPSLKPAVESNYQLLERRYRMNKDSHLELQEKLLRTERTKNCIGTEINSLKPEIKQKQTERGNLYRVLNQRGMSSNDIVNGIRKTDGDEGEDEEEGLYATYAMLHAIRKEADYHRISEEIIKRGRRPPPLPPNDIKNEPRGAFVIIPDSKPPGVAVVHESPMISHMEPPRNIPRDQSGARARMDTVVERPLRQLSSSESFDGQLIDADQLNIRPGMPHLEQHAWMNPSITRDGSRELLLDKRNGTFLVRPKLGIDDAHITAPTHSHTIDIIDRGKFKRIPVFRDPGGGFGFAPPYEFDSLRTLVLYYATNTMEKHNPDLETTLVFPAFL